MGKKHFFAILPLLLIVFSTSISGAWQCKSPSWKKRGQFKKDYAAGGETREQAGQRLEKFVQTMPRECFERMKNRIKIKKKFVENMAKRCAKQTTPSWFCKKISTAQGRLQYVEEKMLAGRRDPKPEKLDPKQDKDITKGLSRQPTGVKAQGAKEDLHSAKASHTAPSRSKLGNKKGLSRGSIQKMLTKAFNNSSLYQPNNQTCEYNRGTALRSDFDSSVGSCSSSFSSAQHSCNAENNSELQSAMSEVKQAIAEVQAAQGTSVQSACQKYTNATEKLNSAINSFANSCDPAQVQCQKNCYAVSVKSSGMGEAISIDPFCTSHSAMMSDIESKKRTADGYSEQCTGFQSTVARAGKDADELANSAITSKLCSQKVARECGENSNDPSCIEGREESKNEISKLSVEGQEIKRPQNYDGFNAPEDRSSKGDRQPASRYGAVYLTANEGMQANGSHSSNAGSAVSRFAAPFDNDSSLGSASANQEKEAPEEKTEGEEEKDLTAQGASPTNSGQSTNQFAQHNKRELRKYMPGGANDPDAELPDGITGENGRSLFEKVSTRYEDHRPHLESFAQQVKNMDKETLKTRVRRKMTRQDHREEVRNRRSQDRKTQK